MPWPAGVTTIVLTASYRTAGDDPCTGTVTAELSFPVASLGNDLFVMPPPVTVNIGETSPGDISIEVPHNDNPTFYPQGTAYKITERVDQWATRVNYYILLREYGVTIDLSDSRLVPVIPVTPLTNFLPLSGGVLTGHLAGAVVPLTDGPSILVDASQGNDFTVTINGDRVMGNPANPTDGQAIRFQITQGTGGDFTVTWSGDYDFGTAGAPVLSEAAGKVDIIGFTYSAALGKWLGVGAALGFGGN